MDIRKNFAADSRCGRIVFVESLSRERLRSRNNHGSRNFGQKANRCLQSSRILETERKWRPDAILAKGKMNRYWFSSAALALLRYLAADESNDVIERHDLPVR